jgi:fermentation-respiration switch protein FrsA (DUF1100 family)
LNYLRGASPPLLAVQGDKYTTLPVHHPRYKQERAISVKVPVENLIVENSDHIWREDRHPLLSSLAEFVARTASFMKHQLDKGPLK